MRRPTDYTSSIPEKRIVTLGELPCFPRIIPVLNEIARTADGTGSEATTFTAEKDRDLEVIFYIGDTLDSTRENYKSLFHIASSPEDDEFPWILVAATEEIRKRVKQVRPEKYADSVEAHIQIDGGILCIGIE